MTFQTFGTMKLKLKLKLRTKKASRCADASSVKRSKIMEIPRKIRQKVSEKTFVAFLMTPSTTVRSFEEDAARFTPESVEEKSKVNGISEMSFYESN